jgi:hypothetical protein
MTDLDRIKEMMIRAKIEFQVNDCILEILAGEGPHNKGYWGFSTIFEFSEEGAYE